MLGGNRARLGVFTNGEGTIAMRYGWLLCLLLVGCTGMAAEPAATSQAVDGVDDDRLVVAWEQEGDLYGWRTGDAAPLRLARAGVVQAFIAPDGERIAFTRGANRAPETLWLVNVDGSGERQLVGEQPAEYQPGQNQIGDVVWLDDDTLYFNTLSHAEPAFTPNFDLYGLEIADGTVTRLLPPGEGGRIHISPDRAHILLAQPGRYGETDARIRRVDPQTPELPRTIFAYPAVASASEFAFSPEIFWEPGSSAALVAIPHPDAVYNEYNAGGSAPVQLWRLPLDAAQSAQNIGQVQASFFSLPRWSDDASRMVYAQRRGETGDQLVLAQGDGANPQVYEAGIRSGSLNVLWLPDTTTFLYTQFLDDQGAFRYLLGNEGREPASVSDAFFILVQFLTAEHYLGWFPAEASATELRLATLGGESIRITSFQGALPAVAAVWLD